jgi:hypothetical protein
VAILPERQPPEAALLAALACTRVHDAPPAIEPGMSTFVADDAGG